CCSTSRRIAMQSTITRRLLLSVQAMLLSVALLTSHASLAQPLNPEVDSELLLGDLKQLQVNVNEADAATMADILVGIGETRARAIVEYREANGRFSTLDDLSEVSGVGEATVMNNRERIRFG